MQRYKTQLNPLRDLTPSAIFWLLFNVICAEKLFSGEKFFQIKRFEISNIFKFLCNELFIRKQAHFLGRRINNLVEKNQIFSLQKRFAFFGSISDKINFLRDLTERILINNQGLCIRNFVVIRIKCSCINFHSSCIDHRNNQTALVSYLQSQNL